MLIVRGIDHVLQRRDSSGGKASAAARPQFGGELFKHGHVIGLAEMWRRNEDRDTRKVERVLEFARAERGINADKNAATSRNGILRNQPLGSVGTPKTNTVALLHSQPQQPAGQLANLLVELPVCVSFSLVATDQSLTVGVFRESLVKETANRLPVQGEASRAPKIGVVCEHLNEGSRSVQFGILDPNSCAV